MNENADMDALYGETKPAAKPGARSKPKSIDEQEAQDMAKTALVPLDCLKRKDGSIPAEGEEIMVKVEKIHGNEAELSYVDQEEPKPEMAMAKADDGDDGYAEMLKE
jgi:hypothetical protein